MVKDEIKLLEGEEWRNISGYEGRYAVSSLGRIACKGKGTWKIIKTTVDKKGYENVSLYSNGKNKSFRVHRIVANEFIPMIEGKNEIHHCDENKLNNKVTNLNAYGSSLYNSLSKRNKLRCSKKVYQFYNDGEYIRCFDSAKEASDATGVCQRNILQVANMEAGKNNRRRYTAGGYIWSYDKEIDLDEWYNGYTL